MSGLLIAVHGGAGEDAVASGKGVTSKMSNGWSRVFCFRAHDGRGAIRAMSVKDMIIPWTVVARIGRSTMPILSHCKIIRVRNVSKLSADWCAQKRTYLATRLWDFLERATQCPLDTNTWVGQW